MSEDKPGEGKCVICGKQKDPKYRPFCSKRCADVDLNRWFNGSYAIPASEGGDPGDDEGRES